MTIEAKVIEQEGIRWVEYEIHSELRDDGFKYIPEHKGIPPEHWGEKTDKSFVRVKECLPYQQI